MFELFAQRSELRVTGESHTLTSGAVNVFRCRFRFGPEWNGLAKTAVFQAGCCRVSVALEGECVCAIPWEVLRNKRLQLQAGVYGTKDGVVVLPTVWAALGVIQPGTETGTPAMPPTPGAYEQLLGLIGDLSALETTAKDSLVSAVNEVFHMGGGGGGALYVHRQDTPAGLWSVQHNLGKKCPNIVAIDGAGNRVFGDVDYYSDNLLHIRFSRPVSGSAYLT